jgi:hypothetical protein
MSILVSTAAGPHCLAISDIFLSAPVRRTCTWVKRLNNRSKRYKSNVAWYGIGGRSEETMLVMHCSGRVHRVYSRLAHRRREKENERGKTALAARWLISFVPTMNDTIYLNGIEIGCTRALFTHNILVTLKQPVERSHDRNTRTIEHPTDFQLLEYPFRLARRTYVGNS